ncbi:hypothetical protein IWQ60_010838 [Tieghemiomyces parasiticus]|uniref:Uncharacterized protein n=1 Tax=Tieghemiomyces parasiticus TaxID=78921 RepID=A0A9W8DM86_9FUNG|nr:hypothetical protein IWQ60_010838 [Tieghemiomyces parasiticus]
MHFRFALPAAFALAVLAVATVSATPEPGFNRMANNWRTNKGASTGRRVTEAGKGLAGIKTRRQGGKLPDASGGKPPNASGGKLPDAAGGEAAA